jgi:hypothetical protein
VDYDHILKALEAAAKRGRPRADRGRGTGQLLLAGSNDETQFPGIPGLIGVTLNFLKPVADRGPRWSFVVKVLRQKTMLVSLLGCDERMLVTPS